MLDCSISLCNATHIFTSLFDASLNVTFVALNLFFSFADSFPLEDLKRHGLETSWPANGMGSL